MRVLFAIAYKILPASGFAGFNDDGVAEAYADVAPEYESTASEARDDCPVSVIEIEGDCAN